MKTYSVFHLFPCIIKSHFYETKHQKVMILEEKPSVFVELKYAKTNGNFNMFFKNINLMFQCDFGPRGWPPLPNLLSGTLTFIDTDPKKLKV